jgi:hypothetical protein
MEKGRYVDTVVTTLSRQRNRRKMCHGRDIRRRKYTAARRRRETDNVICLFFLIWVRRILRSVITVCVPLFYNFFFFTNSNLGLKLFGPKTLETAFLRAGARRSKLGERAGALDPRQAPRRGACERASTGCGRRTPDGLRPWARPREALFFFFCVDLADRI